MLLESIASCEAEYLMKEFKSSRKSPDFLPSSNLLFLKQVIKILLKGILQMHQKKRRVNYCRWVLGTEKFEINFVKLTIIFPVTYHLLHKVLMS